MRSNGSTVEDYFSDKLTSQLPLGFEVFRQASDQFQKTRISLAPLEATLLQTLVKAHGGTKWVEIGTLTGFSGYCISQASKGHLWTFEKDPAHAARARELFRDQNLHDRITVVEGDASQTLASIVGEGPFDGLFIDGNKGAYGEYLQWALKNLRPGGMIIADNVYLGGAIWGEAQGSHWSASVVQRMREFLTVLFDPNLFTASVAPTSEGLAIAIKK
ncbi:MAG: class I SAM-dependent methyltransferase [Bdellovibrionaceae bacterium]|nr:class I SAM-dependent methyltransferase [Pseudobdellovibrionaceae bacterium]